MSIRAQEKDAVAADVAPVILSDDPGDPYMK
jgi:hypothetical protein